MSRVQGLEKQQIRDPAILRVLDSQQRRYGEMLPNHAVLARVPGLFRGFRAMWDSLEESALLGGRLSCLVNVCVAGWIGCGL
jgi:hypothetical protein